jgi:hypothetical protein
MKLLYLENDNKIEKFWDYFEPIWLRINDLHTWTVEDYGEVQNQTNYISGVLQSSTDG